MKKGRPWRGLAIGLLLLLAGGWHSPLRAQDNDSVDDDASPDDDSPDDATSPADDTSPGDDADDDGSPDDDATIDAGRSSVIGDSGCGC